MSGHQKLGEEGVSRWSPEDVQGKEITLRYSRDGDIIIHLSTPTELATLTHVMSCHVMSCHAQSCLNLCDPRNCSLPGSTVHGIFRSRIPTELPFPPPRDLPNPRIETAFPASTALQADSLKLSHRKPHTKPDPNVNYGDDEVLKSGSSAVTKAPLW